MFLANYKVEQKINCMKTFFLTIGLAVLSMSFTLQGGIEQIVNAFKNVNTEEIGKQFDDFVDLKLLDKDEIKQNLIDQLTGAVRWTQSVQSMIADGASKFTEVGPGKVLQGLVQKINKDMIVEGVN